MSLPESITRKLWIDQALAHAGWSPTMAFDPHAPCARAALAEQGTLAELLDAEAFHQALCNRRTTPADQMAGIAASRGEGN